MKKKLEQICALWCQEVPKCECQSLFLQISRRKQSQCLGMSRGRDKSGDKSGQFNVLKYSMLALSSLAVSIQC